MTSTEQTPPSGDVTRLPDAIEEELFEAWMGEDRAAAERALDELCTQHPTYADELRRIAKRLDYASGECSRVVPDTTPRPEQIGPYVILEELGRGGFGVVWLAEQTEPLQRRVAVKVLHTAGRSDKVLRRFEAERHTLAQMQHPSIANILDAGTTDGGEPYFVMEHVPGTPITRYSDDHELDIEDRLELFLQVCNAVQHAHQNGVIHRDLKPGNVLVRDQDGPLVKVIDFGLAKALQPQASEETGITEEGRFVGTPEYMSPEQASGVTVDTRTDVYALGVLLYELLTGELPIPSEKLRSGGWRLTMQVLREQEPLRPSEALQRSASGMARVAARRSMTEIEMLRSVRGDLDWITMKALAKDREERFATVADLAADVRRHMHDLPVSVGPPSLGYQARKFARRHRAGVLATGIIAVLLVAATIVGIWAFAEIVRGKADAEHNAYAAQIAVAKAALDMRRTRPMREALQRASPELRGWEWRYLAAQSDQSDAAIGTGVGTMHGPVLLDRGRIALVSHRIADWSHVEAWDLATGELRYSIRGAAYEAFDLSASSDGRLFAVGYTQPATVHLHDAGDGKPVLWTKGGASIPAVIELEDTHAVCAFSPRGDVIAVGAKHKIRVIDVATGAEIHAALSCEFVQDLCFTRDGSRLLGCSFRKGVFVWDFPSCELRHVLTGNDGGRSKDNDVYLRRIDVDARDRRVAVACEWEQIVRIYDLESGKQNTLLRPRRGVTDVAFSPDGTTLVSAHGDGTMTYWDLESRLSLGTSVGHAQFVDGIEFVPDGSALVSASWDGTLRRWAPAPRASGSDRVSEEGVETIQLVLHPSREIAYHGTLDSELIALDLNTGRRLWTTESRGIGALWIDAAGERLFSGDGDGHIVMRDASTGESLREDDGRPGSIVMLAGSSESNHLAVNRHDSGKTVVSVHDARDLKHVRDFAFEREDASPYQHHYVAFVSNDDDSDRLIVARSRLRMFDPMTGRLLVNTALPARTTGLAVAPDNKSLCLCDEAGRITIHSAKTGRVIRVVHDQDPSKELLSPVFTPNGRRIAIGDVRNGAVRIFDSLRGIELLSLYDHQGWCSQLAFDRGGVRLYIANWNGKNPRQIRVWKAPLSASLER